MERHQRLSKGYTLPHGCTHTFALHSECKARYILCPGCGLRPGSCTEDTYIYRELHKGNVHTMRNTWSEIYATRGKVTKREDYKEGYTRKGFTQRESWTWRDFIHREG